MYTSTNSFVFHVSNAFELEYVLIIFHFNFNFFVPFMYGLQRVPKLS